MRTGYKQALHLSLLIFFKLYFYLLFQEIKTSSLNQIFSSSSEARFGDSLETFRKTFAIDPKSITFARRLYRLRQLRRFHRLLGFRVSRICWKTAITFAAFYPELLIPITSSLTESWNIAKVKKKQNKNVT